MRTLFDRIAPQIKALTKTLLALGLIAVLVFGQANSALAARSGGRIGGGSFRSAPRSYSAPRCYSSPRTAPYRGGGYGYGGGGFGFPFLLPFFGFGGGFGGLFTILIFISVANFIVRSFRNAGVEEDYGTGAAKLSVAKVQVGLLAEARYLQQDLNRMAESADTSGASGLSQVLQEATLSLLRHPEYWIYAAAESDQARLESAEAKFNRLALTERSKFTGESVSNVNNLLKRADREAKAGSAIVESEMSGEYIVATLLVATRRKLDLPKVSSTQDLRQALSQVGSVCADEMVALEVLWTPQADGETLTADELVAEYPELVRI